jgi:hypothetical protein
LLRRTSFLFELVLLKLLSLRTTALRKKSKQFLEMLLRQADASATIPDEEIIECLLNHQNLSGQATKMLNELSEDEKSRTGLVKLGGEWYRSSISRRMR